MDALAAVGLAGNIVQFVDFSFKIYGKTREVLSSAHGATQFNLELEQFCLRLEDFNSKLSPIDQSINRHPTNIPSRQEDLARRHGDTIRQHVDGVKGIASDCTLVCNELLGVLRHLRHDSSGRLRLPKALVKVIREQFKSKKIAHLEEKLKNFQAPLLLHLTALLNERQIYMTRLLESVASDHHERQFSQTERFDGLKSQLNTMADDIKAMSTKLHGQATTRTHIPYSGIEDLEHLLSGLRLSEEGIGKAAKEQEIIQSLSFPEKTLRHENITEAHQKTFEWVLQSRNEPLSAGRHGKKPTELSQGGDFFNWLQHGNGIFWITGKPGSGKSTLMKFIAGHYKTRHALKSWAGEKDVVIATHYFWAIGTEKQKSERGLLQKMVFDVLSQCPQLAWDIFPERCKQGHQTSTAASFSLPHGEAWPLAELRQALLLLSEATPTPVKFCFFIDGLDEYSEDHIDLCQTIKGFAKSENVKCCVSSRPWNEFEAAFGGEQSTLLRVHELTQNDIRRFAHDRLTDIPSEMDNPVKESLTDLADTVAERAEGVFLWVFLVTRELREGMSNGDTMAELSALLESVPSELEEYFKHMMESVPARHHLYMAKTLQIALTENSLSLDVYRAYELKIVDADFAWSMPINLRSKFYDRQSSDYKACKQRINCRCKGLLSFSRNDNVDFIHRTVYSYLMTPPMQDYLNSKIKATFHPSLAILESRLFSLRYQAVELMWTGYPFFTEAAPIRWLNCFDFLVRAMAEDKETTFGLMDKLANLQYRVEPRIASRLQGHLDSWFIKPGMFLKLTGTPDSFAPVSGTGGNNHDMVKLCSKGTLLSSGCWPYVMARLRDNRDYFRADGLSALGVVLCDTKLADKRLSSVTELLEMGFDPNECLDDAKTHTTPWKSFLDWSEDSINNWARSKIHLFYDIALPFLKHGADKSLLVDSPVKLVPRIIYDICVGFPSPKSLQDVLAVLFDTPFETKALLLKRFSEEFARFSSKRGNKGRSDWAARAAIVEMISIEMMGVSLNRKSFTKWLSEWRKFSDSISPRLEEMAEEYLRASLDEEASEETAREIAGCSLETMAEDDLQASLDEDTSVESAREIPGYIPEAMDEDDLHASLNEEASEESTSEKADCDPEAMDEDDIQASLDEEASEYSESEIADCLLEAMDEDTPGDSLKRSQDKSNVEASSQMPKRRKKAEP